MEKVVPVSIAKEVDVPEVRRNKELMKNFGTGYIYQKGMESLEVKWHYQEQRRKAGLSARPEDVFFTPEDEDHLHAVPSSDLLNKMYKEMTYKKALAFLQSYHNMMTNDKGNKNGLNLLQSLGRTGEWMVDLALLRLEQWNHDHRGLANAVALGLIEENENEEASAEKSMERAQVKHSLTEEDKAEMARNEKWMTEIPRGALFLRAYNEKDMIGNGENPFNLEGRNLEAFQELSYEEAVKKAEHAMQYMRANPNSKMYIQRNSSKTPEEEGYQTMDIVLLRLLEHNIKKSQAEKGSKTAVSKDQKQEESKKVAPEKKAEKTPVRSLLTKGTKEGDATAQLASKRKQMLLA